MRIPYLLPLAALLAAALPAQLPRGHAVVARSWNPVQPGVLGGLRVFHPFHGGFQDVTGLPPKLTGAAYNPMPSYGVGANSVLVRDADGALFVGACVRNGLALEIYELTLNGVVATVQATHFVGTPFNGVHVDQMAWLPGGDILFTHRGAMPGFPNQGIATLDPTTGAVTSVPFAPLPANWLLNALAVDPNGSTAYVGMFGINGNAGTSQVFAVPLPTGGAPAAVLSTPLTGSICQLQFDCQGRLLAGSQGGGATSGLVQIDPVAGTATQLLAYNGLNGMAVDEVTGDVVLAYIQAATSGSHPDRWDGAVLTPLPGMPPTDSPTGVALRSSMATFGAVLPNAPETATWRVCPNPGGAPVSPLAGPSPFGISVDVTPNAHVGVVWFALAKTPPTSLGPAVNVMLDPVLLLGPAPMMIPTGVPTTYTIPFPLPAGFIPLGSPPLLLFAQPFHLDPVSGTITGGQGLEFSIH